MPRLKSVLAAVLLAGLSLPFLAQDEPAETFTERIEVRAINLEAVVVDRDGQRVPGLGKDDFKLLVGGQERPIDFFTEVREGKVVASDAGLPELTAGEAAGTSILLFIDEFFVIDRDKRRVLDALDERRKNLGPKDHVAIAAWNGKSLDVIGEWSSDAGEVEAMVTAARKRKGLGLERRLERQQFGITGDPMDLRTSTMGGDRWSLGTQERQYTGMLVGQLQSVMGAAAAAMRGLPTPAGRKILVLLSGGWPMEVDDFVGRSYTRAIVEPGVPNGADLYGPLSDTANLMGYTIYGVDMPGLQSTSGADASRRRPTPNVVTSAEFFLEGEIHNSLHFLAHETGGRALINGQRISAFDDVRQDVSSYYWLGVEPQLAGDDERHDIRVEVKNQDLAVRTRANFVDVSPQTQLSMAVQSSLLYGPFGVSSELTATLGESEKAGKGKVTTTLEIKLPMSALSSVETEDGWVTRLDLFVAALDEKGARSAVVATPLVFQSRKKPRGSETMRYETDLELRRKTRQVAVAVYDQIGGETYTAAVQVGK